MCNRLSQLALCGFVLALFVTVGCGDDGNTVIEPDANENLIEDPGLDIAAPGSSEGKGQ